MQRIENIQLVTLDAELSDYGLIEDAIVIVNGTHIEWAGPAFDAPSTPTAEVIDGQGGLMTPGLVDCHTHLVWAGSRANEFAQRLHGATYAEIAQAGGGIAATVRATREASYDELLQLALKRAKALIAQGVTTLEIKSGYGLDLETERKQLQVARAVGEQLRTSENPCYGSRFWFKNNADGYIDEIVERILPTLADEGLVDAVDAFCESIGFSPAQTKRVFEAAQSLSLPSNYTPSKSRINKVLAAAQFEALSADHLEQPTKQVFKRWQRPVPSQLLPERFTFRDDQVPVLNCCVSTESDGDCYRC